MPKRAARESPNQRTIEMTIRILHYLLAPIALMSALPAMASVGSAPGPAAQVLIAEADTVAPDHADYAQRARAELKVWRIKLDQYGLYAMADAQAARKATSEDLNAAWTRTKESLDRLETASAADWEDAKASYKKASDELAAAWTKVRAEVK
jgi:hypothetical protein